MALMDLPDSEEMIMGESAEAFRQIEESAYVRYHEALKDVPDHARATVERLCSQAVSYVWGFQDAGGEVKNTERSTEFGYAFGVVCARYEIPNNGVGSRPPIQDAWRSWQQHEEIRAWDGARLDG